MSCSTCNPVEIFCCSDELIIGDFPDPLKSYNLWIEDISNGRIIILPITNVGGQMAVDISGFTFAETHSFEFYVTDVTAPEIKIEWQINSIMVQCLQVRFKKAYDENGEVYSITSQVITL
jgi:hypothetical protein